MMGRLNVIKELMTPPWLKEKLIPGLPLTEEHVRPFIGMYWDFFGLDHGDHGKEALIVFLVKFGMERKRYNLKNVEPVQWGFVNGFDKGYEAGYQEHLNAFEESNAINSKIIEENQLIIEHTRAESDRIIADAKLMIETAHRNLVEVMRLKGLNDQEIKAIYEKAYPDGIVSLQGAIQLVESANDR